MPETDTIQNRGPVNADDVRAALLAFLRAKKQSDLTQRIAKRVSELCLEREQEVKDAKEDLGQLTTALGCNCPTVGESTDAVVALFERFGGLLLGENKTDGFGIGTLSFALRVQAQSVEELLWQTLRFETGDQVEVTVRNEYPETLKEPA